MSDTQLKFTGTRSHVEGKIYSLLFDMIKNDTHWKYPIHAMIPQTMFEQFNKACIFYTSGGLTIVKTHPDSMIEVKANGYYVDCGA